MEGMPDQKFPALRYLLDCPERLYPEERLELQRALGQLARGGIACACSPDEGVRCRWHADIAAVQS